jgi:uncharacterized membrane protein
LTGPRRSPVVSSGLLLGVGLGGFVDGILLHQILQWHNMLSSRVAPVDLVRMKYNMVWDGLFHAFTWITTVIGLSLLWRAAARRDVARRDVDWSTRIFVGALAFGWGLFNFVEGVIDHEILRLHHVHGDVNQAAWDIGFLLFGVALMAIGSWLIRRPTKTPVYVPSGRRSPA